MKSLINKGLVAFAVAACMATGFAGGAFAQRPSRGGGSSGGGGGFSGGGRTSVAPSRGGSFSRPSMSAPSGNRVSQAPSRGSYRPDQAYNRPGYGGRPTRPGYNPGRPGYGGSYRPGYGGSYRPHYGYRPYYSYYNFYRPFLGIRIGVLPYGYYPFNYGPDQFYYSGGLFYRQNDSNYEVVAPPLGAEVPNLPDGAQQVAINGQTYYEYKGVYYTESTNADGKTVYIVAGKDGVLNTGEAATTNYQVGDLIDQLPEGCRAVTIKNEKYFVSPDDVYYEEVTDGGKTTYRVIGKLF